jgi:hypothetical protein
MDKLIKKCLTDAQYNGKYLKNYKKGDNLLDEILEAWLHKVESEFSSLNSISLNQPKIISVFYRYIQWSLSVNKSSSEIKLADYVIAYLKNDSINKSNKTILIKSLNNEIQAYSKDSILGEGDPMSKLFGEEKSKEVISLLAGT